MIILQLLMGYYGKHPNSWDEHIAYIQYSYNRVVHTSTSNTLFETYFGYLPSSPFDGSKLILMQPWGRKSIKLRNSLKKLDLMQEQLKISQVEYKSRHDKHKIDNKC